jgi:hypothetical protein
LDFFDLSPGNGSIRLQGILGSIIHLQSSAIDE